MRENPVDSKKSDSGGEGVSAGLTMMDECNEEEECSSIKTNDVNHHAIVMTPLTGWSGPEIEYFRSWVHFLSRGPVLCTSKWSAG
jgi:hypothetical protein